jgi:hypothetical protein
MPPQARGPQVRQERGQADESIARSTFPRGMVRLLNVGSVYTVLAMGI